MQKREAKTHIEKLKTFELMLEKFGAVDMVTFLLQHFRSRPRQSSSIPEIRKHLQQYLAELRYPGEHHKPEAEIVLTVMLEVVLSKIQTLSPTSFERHSSRRFEFRSFNPNPDP